MLTPREQEYLQLAVGCAFTVINSKTKACVDPEETHIVVEAKLEENDDQSDEAAEYLALPILYTLASLSFHDARPRGLSDADFDPADYLKLEEFLEFLRYGPLGTLTWSGDYFKGRRVKTDLEVRPDGSFRLEAHSRGHAPLHWIEMLRGNGQRLRAIPAMEVQPSTST